MHSLLHTSAQSVHIAHLCLHVGACPGCGCGWLLHRLHWLWVCPAWKQRDVSGSFEDQEAPRLGHNWVSDKKSRLGWELFLSPHPSSFRGQSEQKQYTEVWGMERARYRRKDPRRP